MSIRTSKYDWINGYVIIAATGFTYFPYLRIMQADELSYGNQNVCTFLNNLSDQNFTCKDLFLQNESISKCHSVRYFS